MIFLLFKKKRPFCVVMMGDFEIGKTGKIWKIIIVGKLLFQIRKSANVLMRLDHAIKKCSHPVRNTAPGTLLVYGHLEMAYLDIFP